MKSRFSLTVILVCTTLITAAQVSPFLNFNGKEVVLSNLPEGISLDDVQQDFQIYTEAGRKFNQPVSGAYSQEKNEILFTPEFSFVAGEQYHAVFNFNGKVLELSFSKPKDELTATYVERIFPESSIMPENVLRMYIYFSAPMMPGEAYQNIKLIDSKGQQVARPFLIVDQELWDSERKRFTLLFDPGRIKRSLKSNLDLGAPLNPGDTYQLLIDSAWRDVHGNALRRSIRKSFSVSDAQRSKLSVKKWKVIAPRNNSDVLTIVFDRPMDHALALKYIVVKGNSSAPVPGKISFDDDTTWTFSPDDSWTQGRYIISVSPVIEDVAGNNINNAFDLDLSKEPRVNSEAWVEVEFVVPATGSQRPVAGY